MKRVKWKTAVQAAVVGSAALMSGTLAAAGWHAYKRGWKPDLSCIRQHGLMTTCFKPVEVPLPARNPLHVCQSPQYNADGNLIWEYKDYLPGCSQPHQVVGRGEGIEI